MQKIIKYYISLFLNKNYYKSIINSYIRYIRHTLNYIFTNNNYSDNYLKDIEA